MQQESVGMLQQKIALVTGANKGIGLEITKKLCEANFQTIVGCRDETLGRATVSKLQSDGYKNVMFCRIDLNDSESITDASNFISDRFGGRMDVLVNNAAVCFNDPTLYGKVPFTPFEKQAAISISTNFFGTLGVTQAMLPHLRRSSSPRIINIASAAGRLSILKSQALVEQFTSPNLQLDDLKSLLNEFVRDVESGVHAEKGWPNTCYGMSKLGIIAMTNILAREEPSMMINCVDPGFCSTDQNDNYGGARPAELGARTPALLSKISKKVSGKYFFDEKEIQW